MQQEDKRAPGREKRTYRGGATDTVPWNHTE